MLINNKGCPNVRDTLYFYSKCLLCHFRQNPDKRLML
jgi:hypothetical protein